MTPPREKRLKRARKEKLRISQQMHALESGELNLRDVLENPPTHLGKVQINTILCHTPKLGKKGARRVLEAAQVWPLEKLNAVSHEKRLEVLMALPERVANLYPKSRND